MRITYDRSVDAAYVYFTDAPVIPPVETVPCGTPDGEPGVEAIINLDFNNGKIVGLEVLDASRWLDAGLLEEASRPTR